MVFVTEILVTIINKTNQTNDTPWLKQIGILIILFYIIKHLEVGSC